MNIIGISEGFHDAALCLLQNSKILYASQDGVRTDFNTKYLLKSYLKKLIFISSS